MSGAHIPPGMRYPAGSARAGETFAATPPPERAKRQPCPTCGNLVCSCLVDTLVGMMGYAGLPKPESEYFFWPGRKFAFDLAYPRIRLSIECEGGTWSGGRHVTGAGYERDCEKYSEAAARGWRVLRLTRTMIEDGRAIGLIERAIDGR